MDSHILDRPIWHSLSTSHTAFAVGDEAARRFRQEISIFAGTKDDSAASLASLARVMPDNGNLFLIQVAPIILPDGIRAAMAGKGNQMVLQKLAASRKNIPHIEKLTDADAEDMLALALLTRPGPYLRDTRLLGDYWGVKEDGKLIAMAGERFKHPGYTEISGVCTHPDHLGRGLAHALCIRVAERILDRGETPYLHVFSTNVRAIRVYEDLGFKTRQMVNAVRLERG
jgi:predicted GNAT family acetyltransferase